MTNGYIEEMLGENERILLVTRQHGFVLFGQIVLEIVLMATIILGTTLLAAIYPQAIVGYVLVLVPLAGMVRDILAWSNRQYIVTSRRVIQTSGILSKEVLDTSLEKVNDVKMTQTFGGRLFDYGDIQILTASEMGMDHFRSIGDPVKFKTAMLNAKARLGLDEPGSRAMTEEDIPSLIEGLDDLRKKGIISEEEFQQKKRELLSKM
jgi:uncharacterized membrane protein YdbT with pleckstrin-like domain